MSSRIVIALSNARTAEDEVRLSEWYRDVHVPQLLQRVPSIIGASRFRMTDQQTDPRWLPEQRRLTIYRLADRPDVVETVVHELGVASTDGSLDFTSALDLRTMRQAVFELE